MSEKVQNTNTSCNYGEYSDPQGVNTTKRKTGNVAVQNTIGVKPDTSQGPSAGGSSRQVRHEQEGGGY